VPRTDHYSLSTFISILVLVQDVSKFSISAFAAVSIVITNVRQINPKMRHSDSVMTIAYFVLNLVFSCCCDGFSPWLSSIEDGDDSVDSPNNRG
jgi:hypothetical protein